MKAEIIEIASQDLDTIGPLWEKLNEHQKARSPHFSRHYARRTWLARKTELLETSKNGSLRIDIAKDLDTGNLIGYCVSTVSADRHGCLESIYLEPDCRKYGIGDALIKKALDWMNEKQAKTKTLIVGVGNEEVLSFYARYGFYPKHITVEQIQ